MNPTELPKQFEQVLDNNEKTLWVGKPKFIPFLATGIPFLIIGLIWFCIDYFGFIRNMELDESAYFTIPFFLLHLFVYRLCTHPAQLARLPYPVAQIAENHDTTHDVAFFIADAGNRLLNGEGQPETVKQDCGAVMRGGAVIGKDLTWQRWQR